jgi:two-component system phosphate regulon sensor histidine kinase PhoR
LNIENQKLQQRIIEQNSIIENNQKQNRKLERKLGKVSTRLEAIAKTVREILLVMDKRLLVRYVSPLARQLFGKSIHDRPDLLRYTEHPELVQLVQDAMSDENAWVDLDWQVQIANVPYQARIVTFDDGVVLALRDVSLLQRLERARREFVGNISHELRTPLASIVLVLESLLENSTAQSADTLAGLHKIQAEVDELQQMAQELLDLAQIESGRALFRLMPIGVEDLFEPAFERMREQATRKEQNPYHQLWKRFGCFG